MPDIQIFWTLFNAGGRIHFATIPDDVGGYKPYDGLRFEYRNTKRHSDEEEIYQFPGYVTRKTPFSSFADLVIGLKNFHFDMWTSIPKPWGPLFSVHYYYHERRRLAKGLPIENHLVWKRIGIPDLVDILKHLRFKKRWAKAEREPKKAVEGLGALFS